MLPLSEKVKQPQEPDWDDLKLQYQRNETKISAADFVGRELLEQFVRQSTVHDWSKLKADLGSVAGRQMLMPLGEVRNRGRKRWDEMDLGEHGRIWTVYKDVLKEKYGIPQLRLINNANEFLF